MSGPSGIDIPLDDPLSGGVISGEPAEGHFGVGGGIDVPFNEPFFGGSGSQQDTSLVPDFFQVAINGHGYVIEPSKYQRQTVPLQRQSVDDSVEPGEQSLDSSGSWPRSQDNWFLGAGQEFLDNRFAYVTVYTHSGEVPSVRTRFWRSKGLDPWTEGKMKLLPECNRKWAFAGTGSKVIGVGPYLYLWDGTTLSFTESPTDSAPVFTPVTPPTGSDWPAILDITTDGSKLYLALGSAGMATVDAGASTSSVIRPTPDAPTVVANGTTGSTTYEYFVVGTDENGFKTLVSAGTSITNGNATLTAGNFNEVTWNPVDGMVTYDVLKGDTSHSVALGVTGTSFTDDGTVVSTSAYTAPTDSTDNFQPEFVSYGNGFLLAGRGPLLVEVLADGGTTTVMKHNNPGWTWNAGCGSPTAIFVSGSAGNICELYGIQLSSTTFGLDSPFIAGAVTRGEIIRDLCYYEGLVVIATSLGVRVANDPNSTGHLDSGPIITDPGDSKCCVPWGPFVWFGWTNFETDDGVYPNAVTATGLGRMSLTEFSAPLTPAYATDVMAEDNVEGTVTSCEVIDGNLYFTVDGNGLWGPNGNVCPSGFFESGWVRYGSTEEKILLSMALSCEPLNGSISIEAVPSSGQSSVVAQLSDHGSVGPASAWSGGLRTGEEFMVIPTLTREPTDATKGPVLRSWIARALVTATRQYQIVVPIIWRESVMTPVGDGQQFDQDLIAERKFLEGLEQLGAPITYQEGTDSRSCFIDQIELDGGEKWTSDRSAIEGILQVKLLTLNR